MDTDFTSFNAAADAGSTNFSTMPDYMVAASTHDIGNNGGDSFISRVGSFVSNTPEFLGVSAVSGLNSIYNTGVEVANWFGADAQKTSTAQFLASVDSNVADYYMQNQQSADAIGFFLTSLAPGIGGIKVLKASQVALRSGIETGIFGDNIGGALGLLTPNMPKLLDAAKASLAENGNAFRLINSATLTAIGAGVGQAALEGAAFQTAVTAAMHSSPLLENEDFGDMFSNILTVGGVNAIFGGAIEAAGIISKVKTARNLSDIAMKPFEADSGVELGMKPADKIAIYLDDLRNIPPVPEDGIVVDGVGDLTVRAKKSAAAKEMRLLGNIRAEAGNLTGGDQVAAQQLFSGLKAIGSNEILTSQNLNGLEEVGILSKRFQLESTEKSLAKKVVDETATQEELDAYKDINIGYLKVHGEGSGVITDTAPEVRNIPDTLKANQAVAFKDGAVRIVDATTNATLDTLAKLVPEKSEPITTAIADTQKAQFALEARYIAAKESPKLTPTPAKPLTINIGDIPLMEKAYLENTPLDNVKLVQIRNKELIPVDTPSSRAEFLDILRQSKDDVANELEATGKLNPSQIAKAVNVRGSYLNGVQSTNPADDLFAFQLASREYTDRQVELGLHNPLTPDIKTYLQPSVLKLGYSKGDVLDLDGNLVNGLVLAKERQVLMQNAVDNATAGFFGNEFNAQMPMIRDKDVATATRGGAGGGFFNFASGTYGQLDAAMEYLGNITSRLVARGRDKVNTQLQPLLMRLANSPADAVEFSSLLNKVRSIPENYYINETGTGLRLAKLVEYEEAGGEQAGVKAPQLLDNSIPEDIPFSENIADLVQAHVDLNGDRAISTRNIRAAQSLSTNRNPRVFYAPPVDPAKFKYFMIVKDDTVTSTGHIKYLYANDEESLNGMVANVEKNNPELTILSRADSEKYYKERGEYAYANTLHDNYLDTAMARSGVSTPFYTPTDPVKIATDLLDWHVREESQLARLAINAKYEPQFDILRKQGIAFTNIATSKFGGSIGKYASSNVANPYEEYLKTALNISHLNEYPLYSAINNTVENAVSFVTKKIGDILNTAKAPADLDTINSVLQKSGINSAYYDAATNIWANHQAAGKPLSQFIGRSNSILASLVLGLDPINAAVNYVSSHILVGTEFTSILNNIRAGNANAVGELSKLMDLQVPGVKDIISSPSKLMAQAYSDLWNDDGTIMNSYKSAGVNTTILQQFKSIQDELTLNGSETAVHLDTKIQNALAKLNQNLAEVGKEGYRLTGNNLAEQTNRFLPARMMEILCNIAVKNGIMEQEDVLPYINTAVNRTQGNFLASQRPGVFQGPIGQAIGLFQTYQFNLMQQLFRYVGEGQGKDAAMLLGLQGTIYGANGLPAFNAINQHILGTLSGNTNHTDAYSTIYGAAGKEAGDWLIYGLASNMLIDPNLKMNLYSRGDINPRQLSIIPVLPSQTPIYSAYAKFFGALSDTIGKISGGGNVWNSLLQGIEHGSVNRPLTGIAQVLEGLGNPQGQSYSTSNKGDIIASNDLMSLANFARLAGAKPLDEAVAIDNAFRMSAYGLEDSAKRTELGEAIKTKVIANQTPSIEEINDFATKYAAAGGQSQDFNKWYVGLFKEANSSQVNKIAANLKNPTAQNMQRIMGGYSLKDFSNDGL